MTRCPVCEGALVPVKLRCSACDLSVEGQFPKARLALLADDQQEFIQAFLVARGNIKEVEKELGISYPTVRKRLEEVIEALGYPPREVRLGQQEILDAVDCGEMSAREGIQKLNQGEPSKG